MLINSSTGKTTRHSLPHLFLFVLIVFSLIFASTLEVRAAEVTLAWDPNPEPSVQGYRVYYGKASGFYTNVLDVGNRTDCVIPGLDAGTTYFFACTAYSATGDESNFSGEIVYATDGGIFRFIRLIRFPVRGEVLHRHGGLRQRACARGVDAAGIP